MRIVIEVYGGIASVTEKDAGVEVVIIDHDNSSKSVWREELAFKETNKKEVM